MANDRHTFIVEHLDPELEDWQVLEYNTISEECAQAGSKFLLTGLANASEFSTKLSVPTSSLITDSVESLYSDPEAKRRVCLLDPKGEKDISPEDGAAFDVFVFGGILGDEPPRDRTAELRRLGFVGRRLGPEQMTTDTAARVTRIVVQDKKKLDEIPYIDRPDIELCGAGESGRDGRSNESVSMPFKYIKDEEGRPVMPKGMMALLANDADKDILDLL